MIGDSSFQQYRINTFSGRGKLFSNIDVDVDLKELMKGSRQHYVSPHMVRDYQRRDGTFVAGYWRDGDGNTDINRGYGYFRRNPGEKHRKGIKL